MTVGGTEYFSSTRINITWNPPPSATPRALTYAVALIDSATNVRTVTNIGGTSLSLSGLKSATTYRIEVAVCERVLCATTEAAVLTTRTPPEVWQLSGTGNSVGGLTRIVPDGNVKLDAFRYGGGAPPSLLGRLALYYGPMQMNFKGLAVAQTPNPASATPATYLQFDSRAGTAGLISPPTAAPLVREVNTGQAVPLAAPLASRIRLYFEATGGDNLTRIMFVDSQDGYDGLDFNATASAVCATQADYSIGGGCAPTVAIGVEGDAVAANARIQNARQHKIGLHTQDDWRWNGAVGTFMVFTTDNIPGCSTATPNHGYAVWTGAVWQVQYDATNCPKLFRSMQAAHPLHLGGERFKLYYGDPSDQTGRVPGSGLPFLGPKKVLYGDGTGTGDASRVEFEDWEPTDRGRRLVFLWPNGVALNATANGYIDDFTVLAPTGSLDLQVMYIAITDGVIAPFSAAATLINP